MQHLFFYGYSDDNFVISEQTDNGVKDLDEICTNGGPKPAVIEVRGSDGGRAFVVGQYNPDPRLSWVVSIANHDDTPLPPWRFEYKAGPRDYTPELHVIAPTGVTLKWRDHNKRIECPHCGADLPPNYIDKDEDGE